MLASTTHRSSVYTLLYICFELSVHRVAVKRPAHAESAPKKGFAAGWAALRRAYSQKPHLEKVPYARGVCKKLPISGHSGLVDAADCTHCMHSFQSPIGTHSQREDN